jgi:bifunctional UDP-N-acetylglucosamine pyrophosphorylase/glucosamine-1-phosphate N-acetyltransferase
MGVTAVILAGGIGKRIAPLGINKHKSMFRVLGKPLIFHLLDTLKQSGVVSNLVVITGEHDQALHDALGDGSAFGLPIQYTVQEKPLGQANALLTTRDLVGEQFIVLNANDVFDVSLVEELVKLGSEHKLDVALVGREVDNPNKFGVMSFDADGRLTGVVEKPPVGKEPSNVAVIGLYYFSSRIWEVLDATPLGETDDQLERAYQKLISAGSGGYLRYEGAFASYKFPWDLLRISDLLLQRITEKRIAPSARIAASAVIDDRVIIDENVRVFEHAVIRGPAYIGKNSIIGNNVMVRGGTSLGENCVLGFSTEVSHCVIGDHTWTHMNFLGDSIISDNCSFGAGTITANLRFDEAEVQVQVGDNRLSAGTSHFGMIMAEDCRTGCNAVLSPGVKIGPNSVVGAGVVLKEDLLPNKVALQQKDAYRIVENKVDVHALSREERMKTLKK